MRHFYLRSAAGTLGLNNETGVSVTNVSGLGVSSASTYNCVDASGFYSVANKKMAQGKIAADLVFIGADPHALYRDFIRIASGTEASLVYQETDGGTQYLTDVVIESLSKGELQQPGHLVCPVVLARLTPWYTEEDMTVSGNTLTYTPAGDAGSDYTIRFSLPSSTSNVVTLKRGSSTVLAMTVSSGSEIVINNKRSAFSIARAGGVSILSLVDLSVTTLPELVSGTSTVTLTLTPQSGSLANLSGRARSYYTGV